MSEDFKLEEQVVINSDTKRKTIAVAFRNIFNSEFNTADEAKAELFIIPKKKFDEFVVDNGFCSFDVIPEKGTADWIKFRHESNSGRYELNRAAEIGIHGEPPYRIDNNNGSTLKVRLLASMVKVTHTMIAKQVKTLVANKSKGFEHMMEYLNDIADELPLALQSEIGSQERMFNMTVGNVTHMLQEYIKNVTETYDKASQLRLEPPK